MNRLVREGAWSFGITNVFFVVNFMGNILLVRMLMPEDFGKLATAIGLLGVVELFSTFALPTVYLQHRHSGRLFSTALRLSFVVITLKLVISAAICLVLYLHYDMQIWILFAAMTMTKLLVPVSGLFSAFLEKQYQFTRVTLITNLSNLVGIAVAVGMVAVGAGVWGLLMREIVPTLALFIVLVFLVLPHVPKGVSVRPRYVLAFIKSASEMYFTRANEVAHGRVGYLVIEQLFGPVVLGLLSQSMYLVNFVNRSTNVLNQQIAMVFFSDQDREGEEKRKGAIFLLLVTSLVSVPFAIILFAVPDFVVTLLWTDTWIDAADMLSVLAVLVIAIPVFTLAKARLYAMRLHFQVGILYFVGLITLIGILYLPLSLDADVHTSVATLSSYMIMLAGALLWWRVKRT